MYIGLCNLDLPLIDIEMDIFFFWKYVSVLHNITFSHFGIGFTKLGTGASTDDILALYFILSNYSKHRSALRVLMDRQRRKKCLRFSKHFQGFK